jgi:predicted nucleic acid-binding protein
MLTGVDTGFFFALEDNNPVAVKVWSDRELITSVVVIYELQKKLLKGQFTEWPTLIDDIREATAVVPLTEETALKAAHLAYGTGMPGLDALILSSLLEAECKEIYTTDSHFELYQKKGITIVNLKRQS